MGGTVWVTGDTHAEWMTRFSTGYFPEQKELDRDDFVIVLGDFGLWHDDKSERYRLDWLNDKPWTTLWIDGNHENFDRLSEGEFPVVDFHGGKAHRIRDNIYHLMRGYIFDLCGKSFFAFGGASSHDVRDGILDPCDYESGEAFARVYKEWSEHGRQFRVNHFSWWEQELPSMDEKMLGLKSLGEHDWKVDFVITHCLPQMVASAYGYHEPDAATQYFNAVLESGTEFKDWFCGHYHRDDDYMGKYHVRYYRIERIV